MRNFISCILEDRFQMSSLNLCLVFFFVSRVFFYSSSASSFFASVFVNPLCFFASARHASAMRLPCVCQSRGISKGGSAKKIRFGEKKFGSRQKKRPHKAASLFGRVRLICVNVSLFSWDFYFLNIYKNSLATLCKSV